MTQMREDTGARERAGLIAGKSAPILPDANPLQTSMPLGDGLKRTLRDHDVKGERAIALGQAAISSFVFILHLVMQLRSGWHGPCLWVMSALAALPAALRDDDEVHIASALVQVRAAQREASLAEARLQASLADGRAE